MLYGEDRTYGDIEWLSPANGWAVTTTPDGRRIAHPSFFRVGKKILDTLMEYPHCYTTAEFIDRVWHPDFEPEYVESCVHAALHTLRTRFLPTYYPWLRIVKRGRPARWYLVIRRPDRVQGSGP